MLGHVARNYNNSQCIINFDSTAFYTETAHSDFVVLIYWATFEGVFNKPNNKRAAEALVKTMEQASLKISGYYVNFDKRKGEYSKGEVR